jgi:VIT1/CCC1 family predicted Fe2+/Mn2+ transporter
MKKRGFHVDGEMLIFGIFDGMVSELGIIAACYLAGTSHLLLLTTVAFGVAAAVSMAGGEYLSDTRATGSMQRALVMGLATFVGAILPALPFLFFGKSIALSVGFILVVAIAGCIAQVRATKQGWIRAYVQTFVILLCAAGFSIAVTLAFNLAG